MACLRESSPEEFSGVLLCDEKGCQLRFHTHSSDSGITQETPEAYRVLQLRLRAGDPTNVSGLCPKQITREEYERILGQPVADWQWDYWLKAYRERGLR